MDIKQEYSGPYRWDEARERIPNDYRTKDDKPTEYAHPPMTTEELLSHMQEREEYEDLTNDEIPW